MKKLTKLGISSEKIMKNEELINLQGGAYSVRCACTDVENQVYWDWGMCGGYNNCHSCGVALTHYYQTEIVCVGV